MKYRIYVHDQDQLGNDADYFWGGWYTSPQELATAIADLRQKQENVMEDIVADCDLCQRPTWACACSNCTCAEVFQKCCDEVYKILKAAKPAEAEAKKENDSELDLAGGTTELVSEYEEIYGNPSQYKLNGGRY